MNTCKRIKVIIDKENYYVTVGKEFVHVTLPHENRNLMKPVMDTICEVITQELQNAQKT